MARAKKPAWVAEERVVYVHPDGRRAPGRIAIGAPVRRRQEFACAVTLEPFLPTTMILGETSVQALLLAARFLGALLHDHVTDGIDIRPARGPRDREGDASLAAAEWLQRLFGAYFAPLSWQPPPKKRARTKKRAR